MISTVPRNMVDRLTAVHRRFLYEYWFNMISTVPWNMVDAFTDVDWRVLYEYNIDI
jgi:hypothetical protein